MEAVKNGVLYFLGFKAYVMLPMIIFIFAMVFRIKLNAAIKSSLTIGIGFVGIFIVFDYFVGIISPVVKALVLRTGLHFNVLDVGWPPLAAITWSFKLAPILILVYMVVNVLMLVTKLTKTVDIDIWNYWHFIFIAAIVDNVTNNVLLSITASIVACVITLKIADWCAPMVQKFSGLKGVSIPTLSAVTYFPFGIILDRLISRIPVLNKIDANPERMRDKLGLAGEPMVIGFVMGIVLGIGGGYNVKQTSELAFGVATVIYILPMMAGIVGTSLIPISEGMKSFISKNFPDMGETYIGLDVAVLVGQPSVVVTAILLMPVALVLAFILPGVKFIPIGDLPNIMGTVALVCVATKGNVIRSFITGIPIVIINLYVASNMAVLYTKLAGSVNYKVGNYSGIFTSFLDGGNVLRFWIIKTFEGNILAIAFIPIVGLCLYLTRRYALGEARE